MKHNKFVAITILGFVTLSLAGFFSRPVKGDSNSNLVKFPSGVNTDAFELYESLPYYLSPPDFILPNSVEFVSDFPPPGNQMNQKSSVGFAVGYGLLSYFEASRNKTKNISNISPQSPEGQSIFYSPSYVYNQLNGGRDNGASLLDALVLMQSRGSVPLSEMPYTATGFRNKPGANLIEIGRRKRVSHIYKLDISNITTIKYVLSQKIPVVFSFLTFENFLEWKGNQVYTTPTGEDIGAQTLVLLGYDDSKKAFRVWNSWGNEWGDKGYAWIHYTTFQKLTRAAYLTFPSDAGISLNSEKEVLDIAQNTPIDLIQPPEEVFASKGEFEDRIRLVWSKNNKAIGYEIYRKRKDETKFQLIGLSRTHSFEDKGVQKNVAYAYRIASVNETKISTLSPESNEGYASSEVKNTEILPITNLKASIGKYNDRIQLSWDLHISANSYSVYKWNSTSKIFRFLAKTDKPSYTDYKASKNGDSEIYRVFPHKKSLTGEGSYYAHGYLDPLEQLRQRPTNLYVSKGEFDRKINLSWEGSANASSYLILRSSQEENEWEIIGKSKETKFTDSNFKESEYTYAIVTIFDDGSYSFPSESEFGYVNLLAKRGAVSEITEFKSVSENISKKEMTLSWTKNPKFETYSIYMRKRGDKDWDLVSKLDANKTQYVVSGLDKNKFYIFALKGKESGKDESVFSKPLYAVLSEASFDTKKVKTFGESVINRFLGPWTAMYWDGKSSVKPVKLEIESDSEDGYVLKWNNREFYRGSYIIDANLIEEKGKWKIQLSPNLDSLSAEVSEKQLLPEKSRISFVRE
ncbi:MAG: C1 family peptidase [Leptospira sp.]|nr:C1 family peptidase [Leptospira sp.]